MEISLWRRPLDIKTKQEYYIEIKILGRIKHLTKVLFLQTHLDFEAHLLKTTALKFYRNVLVDGFELVFDSYIEQCPFFLLNTNVLADIADEFYFVTS